MFKHSRFSGHYSRSESQIEKFASDKANYSSKAGDLNYSSASKNLVNAYYRVADCVLSFSAIVVSLPIMFVIYAVLRIECSDAPLVLRSARTPPSKSIATLRFRTRRSDQPHHATMVGKFLLSSGLDRLPYLFSILNGERSYFNNPSPSSRSIDPFENYNAEFPFSLYTNLFKRLIDIVVVILAAPMILLLVGVLYAIVRSDGGPGFFSQRRVGRNGEEFFCWKIRTMQTNAAEMLTEYLNSNDEAAKEWEENRKLADDPRITKIGKILRKTSLDEFPQFWNVLKGEMSVVGPRPVPADELLMYGEKDVFYKAMRPGITGLWQVSGRNETSYDERVLIDQAYTKSVGFFGDMIIILKTVNAMLKRTGG